MINEYRVALEAGHCSLHVHAKRQSWGSTTSEQLRRRSLIIGFYFIPLEVLEVAMECKLAGSLFWGADLTGISTAQLSYSPPTHPLYDSALRASHLR